MDKFCVNCRHAVSTRAGWECGKTARISAVTGEQIRNSCESERGYDFPERCAPEGRFFYPKLEVAA